MEDENEKLIKNEKLDIKEIKLNHKTYNLKLYLKNENIILELESFDNNVKRYKNSFSLDYLKRLDKYFKMPDDIDEAFVYFKKLFKDDYSIEEGDSFADIKLIFQERIIKIHLLENNENKITYDSLSNEMKTIIDNNELILGIDFGTTYSCASVMLDKNIIVIQNSLGLRNTPSFVQFLNNNKIFVGELAKLQPSYEKNIIYNTKRLMGKSINNKEIKEMKNNLLFELENDKSYDLLKIKVNKNTYYPEQISAMILKKIVNDSEYYLSKILKKSTKIKNAIITAPAYFNNNQRKSLLNAANIINLKVKRIINEPTAASLAYLYENLMNIEKTILVLDLGGGTFDITLLYLRQSQNSSYCDIKCTGGDPNFGGEDFDEILMKKCAKKINFPISDFSLIHNIRLKRACENAKIKLSSANKTNIFIEVPPKNIDFTITKEEFEECCSGLFTKFQKIIEDFLKDNEVDKSKISEVIPIGGSILIPKIKEIIRKIFNNSEIKNNLDPKEIVSIGASVQGGIISKLDHLKNYNLLDITNYSLGVELVGEKMSKVIKRYTPIPIEKEKGYTNAYDYPKSIDIKVYEGEDKNIKNNLYLGEFKITNLPRKKKDQINLKIIFKIDINSILEVTAIEKQNKNNLKNKMFNLEKNNENNEIQIINPKELKTIINELRNIENSMEYIEDKLYNDKIKDSILEEEKKINDLKMYENINKQIIQEKKKLIIEKFRSFIIEKLNKIKLYELNKNDEENEEKDRKILEKIIIPYIKYYFKIISNYFKNYEEDNEFKQYVLSQDNLGDILAEIQYINPILLPEIIEEFSDDQQIFQKCIISLIMNSYAKLSQKSLSKEFQNKRSLSGLKIKIKNTLSLFEKINPIPFELKKTKEYLEALKLKIKAKIFILNNNFFSRFISKNKTKLNNLIEQYKNSIDFDVNILNELQRLKNLFYSKRTNMTKDVMFLKYFESRKKESDYLFIIFNEYPTLDDENKVPVYIASDYSNFIQLDKQKKLNFLNDSRMKYEKSLNLIKKDEENNISLQQVYEKIIMLINEVKDEINNKKE